MKYCSEAKTIYQDETIYQERMSRHLDELKWLYMELYDDPEALEELCSRMEIFYQERSHALKQLDRKREQNPEWYRGNDMLGMMMYTDQFAGDLKGVKEKLDYIESCQVRYLHLMPLLESPEGRSDGGYAVVDFRRVQPALGTMEDLEQLAGECRGRGISLCLDFVMNHTSEDHEWAKRASAGEKEYQDRYFFFADDRIPREYEKTVPQVFPTTAPGNFTWLDACGKYVMTTFYPYQWDLNYRNPVVFNEMMYNFLYLANRGVDVFRIDAVPYIWKKLGTNCRNLPQVHTIVRLMRIISEVVCPGIVLLGEVVMEPDKVMPYFGTLEKPECHMLYNVTTMATTWHTAATHDVRLLKQQMEILSRLPQSCTFLNYLRCHDDIGWGLDYHKLETWGMLQVPHKKYLNDYFTGRWPDSVSRGELYNEDPVTGDARFCGTTASMCGIEKAGFEQDAEAMKQAIRADVMLHAYMMFLSGIPMLYSGDELGQVNDYTYKDDPHKVQDSRYIHRGKLIWELAEKIQNPDTVQGQLFPQLMRLQTVRSEEPAFHASAKFSVLETGNDAVLGLLREDQGDRLVGFFNFSGQKQRICLPKAAGYRNLIAGKSVDAACMVPAGDNGFTAVPEHGFYWLKEEV